MYKVLSTPLSPTFLVANAAVFLGIVLLAIAILKNFIQYRTHENRRQFIKSPVDTLTMSLFAVALYGLILFRLGHVSFGWLDDPLRIIGGLLFLFGVAVNLWGRKVLGDNWSNQIRIREAHSLITAGPFKYVRHPLYASIMLMQFAAALVYSNLLVFAINLLLYIPMMNHRAAQEELALAQTFPQYTDYCQTAGRFWPKIRRSS